MDYRMGQNLSLLYIDRRVISKLYKELKELNIKIPNQGNKWVREGKRSFLKNKGQIDNKH